jgi:hypothetical protein
MAAWRRFVSCVSALPPDQAAPLWQAAHAQAALAHDRESNSSVVRGTTFYQIKRRTVSR